MPKMKEFFALSISLVKRDRRSTVKIAESVSPFGWDAIKLLASSDDPSSAKLLQVLNRLKQRIGESGTPVSFEEAAQAIDDKIAQAKADELQELLNAVRRNDPKVAVLVRDDFSTGVRIVSLVTELPKEAHVDKARKADAIYETALSMLDEPLEP